MISRLSLAAGAAAGFFLALLVFYLANQAFWLPAARKEGRELERVALTLATDNAIGELRNAADKARFSRRLCVERGWLYLNSSGKCVERQAEPNG